ncbi:MAG: hypothetical protein JSR58_06540 [Verrucomicrobia bacterium]|nr:hypothetical protein [Verrucomicrobiota bacterium]
MAIFDIAEKHKEESETRSFTKKDRLFSSLTTRILFFLLLIGDVLWAMYGVFVFGVGVLLTVMTLGLWRISKKMVRRQWMNLKRAGVCGISLFIALFSPALGIMIACTYFLMYDKDGIQEVVPTSLQEQFQEFLK